MAVTGAVRTESTRFHDILHKLGEVHDQEVASLRSVLADEGTTSVTSQKCRSMLGTHIETAASPTAAASPKEEGQERRVCFESQSSSFANSNSGRASIPRILSGESNHSTNTSERESVPRYLSNPSTAAMSGNASVASSARSRRSTKAFTVREIWTQDIDVIQQDLIRNEAQEDLGHDGHDQDITASKHVSALSATRKNKFYLTSRFSSRESLFHPVKSMWSVLRRGDSQAHESGAMFAVHWVAYPNSLARLSWDTIGMLLIFSDIIIIPLSLFDPPETTGLVFLSWVSLLFWTADIVASFFTGYYRDGQLVMEPALIAKRYLRSWFIIDALVVLPDWVATTFKAFTSDSGTASAGLQRLVKGLRVLRTIRLLRLFKLRKVVLAIQDHIDSEYVFVFVDVMKLLMGVLFSSHVLACFFYAVGRNGGSNSWAARLEGRSLEYKYATSLHWGLSSLILESMDVEPRNTGERIFTVFSLIMGLMIFSSVVSRLTTAIMKLQDMAEDNQKQFWLLRKYMKQRRVPKPLALRIQRFLEHEIEQQTIFIQESKVTMLSLLSRHLRTELQFTITARVVCAHLYFECISDLSEAIMHRICEEALSKSVLARSDPLFVRGDLGHSMHFIVTGEISYVRKDIHRLLMPRTSICEPVLWCQWTHLGTARASTECEMLSIEMQSFGRALRSSLNVWDKTRVYAREFVDVLNSEDVADVSDLTNFLQLNLKEMLLVSMGMGKPTFAGRISALWPVNRETTTSGHGHLDVVLPGDVVSEFDTDRALEALGLNGRSHVGSRGDEPMGANEVFTFRSRETQGSSLFDLSSAVEGPRSQSLKGHLHVPIQGDESTITDEIVVSQAKDKQRTGTSSIEVSDL